MGTSLKITSAVLLFIGATLIILKGAGNGGIISHVNANHSDDTESKSSLISLKVDFRGVKGTSTDSKSDNDYEPPNYGGPDSPYGSGTR